MLVDSIRNFAERKIGSYGDSASVRASRQRPAKGLTCYRVSGFSISVKIDHMMAQERAVLAKTLVADLSGLEAIVWRRRVECMISWGAAKNAVSGRHARTEIPAGIGALVALSALPRGTVHPCWPLPSSGPYLPCYRNLCESSIHDRLLRRQRMLWWNYPILVGDIGLARPGRLPAGLLHRATSSLARRASLKRRRDGGVEGCSRSSRHRVAGTGSASASANQKRRMPEFAAWWLGLGKDIRQLIRLFKKRPVDLLHSDNAGAEAAPFAARLAGVPRILATWHVDSTYDMGERSSFRYRFLERRCMRSLDHAIALTTNSKIDWIVRTGLGNEFESRVSLIRLSVHLNRLERRRSLAEAKALLRLPPDALVIGSLGRLHPHKGYEYLIRALPRDFATGAGDARGDRREWAARRRITDARLAVGRSAGGPFHWLPGGNPRRAGSRGHLCTAIAV